MTDGPPQKPATPKSATPQAGGTKKPAPSPSSGTPTRPIPKPTPAAKPPSAARTASIKRAATPRPRPVSEAAYSSEEEAEVSDVRRQVASKQSAPKGLPLRWKIVAAMGGIMVVTGILVFTVVYTKTYSQLNEQIDIRGRNLVNTLASVDPEYWVNAIKNADAQPLKELDLNRGRDLLDGGVADVSTGSREFPAISMKGHVDIKLPEARAGETITILEGVRREGNVSIPSRTFVRNPAPDAPRKLRHFVSLSLAGIGEAKSQLFWAIFLPIFFAVIGGIGVAVWISTLITEPIKILMNDIQIVSDGDLDHETRAVSKDEVGLLASAFNRMTTALRSAHEQELEAKALEHELSIASEIQSNLVPKRMLKIPGYDIGAYYRPSKEVGGDYYDFISIDQDNEGIIVADVSGKGVPGSLVMSMTRAFIRMEAERSRNTSPSDTLIRVNRMLAQDIKKGMFVTSLYCILDKQTNEARVASAGHNPMVVWRAATNEIQLVNPSGMALGFDKGPVFERTIKEEKVALNHGDRIVIFTDGAVEMMDAANEEFGDDRFYELIKKLATRDSNQLINLIVKEIDDHRSAAPQHDDITLVTLRYL